MDDNDTDPIDINEDKDKICNECGLDRRNCICEKDVTLKYKYKHKYIWNP